MIKIYYDVDKDVIYTSDTNLNNKFEFSNFSGNAEYYIVQTKNDKQTCEIIYEGGFENGKYNGQGKAYYQGNKIYEGGFKNGEYDGEGSSYYDASCYEPGGIAEKLRYTGEFKYGKFNGKGTVYGNQLRFEGIFVNGVTISGTAYLNKTPNNPCYKLNETKDGIIIEYFLDGEVVTLTIDKDKKLQWSKNITENTIEKTKTLFSSFSKDKSYSYDTLLTNLALINNNDNIIQYSNDKDFDYSRHNFESQLENFKKFAEQYKNTGKVVTSELYTTDHAVGIIYKDGKFVVIDTSGGIYFDKKAIEVLKDDKNKNVDILAYNGQTIGNCVLASRVVTNGLANDILNKQITIDDFILYNKENKDNEQQTEYELKQKAENIRIKEERLRKVTSRLDNIKNKNKYLELATVTGNNIIIIPNGFGKLTFANGDVYEGEFKDGKRNGKGTVIYKNGNKYEGEFKDDKVNGLGTLICANGGVYEGEFKDGKANGLGKRIYANDNKYEGQFKDGKASGKGKFIYANGDVYEGKFENGKMVDGKGKLIDKSGNVYECQVKDNKIVSKGEIIYKNDDKNDDIYKNRPKDSKLIRNTNDNDKQTPHLTIQQMEALEQLNKDFDNISKIGKKEKNFSCNPRSNKG